MKESLVVKDVPQRDYEPLIRVMEENGPSGYFVAVSHRELDTLIGRYMQMCDLIGDVEQRKALKDTIKSISREWLDDRYTQSGYDKWTGVVDDTLPLVVQKPIYIKK